jgi:hypothetical protein
VPGRVRGFSFFPKLMIGCRILRALCEGWDTTALNPKLFPADSAYPTLRKVREGCGTRSLVGAQQALSALDEASFYGDHDRMGAVVCVQLGKDAAHVSLDRILRNFEVVGDDFVGAALSDHAQYLDLAGG